MQGANHPRTIREGKTEASAPVKASDGDSMQLAAATAMIVRLIELKCKHCQCKNVSSGANAGARQAAATHNDSIRSRSDRVSGSTDQTLARSAARVYPGKASPRSYLPNFSRFGLYWRPVPT